MWCGRWFVALSPHGPFNQVLRGLAELPFEPLGVSSLANLTH